MQFRRRHAGAGGGGQRVARICSRISGLSGGGPATRLLPAGSPCQIAACHAFRKSGSPFNARCTVEDDTFAPALASRTLAPPASNSRIVRCQSAQRLQATASSTSGRQSLQGASVGSQRTAEPPGSDGGPCCFDAITLAYLAARGALGR